MVWSVSNDEKFSSVDMDQTFPVFSLTIQGQLICTVAALHNGHPEKVHCQNWWTKLELFIVQNLLWQKWIRKTAQMHGMKWYNYEVTKGVIAVKRRILVYFIHVKLNGLPVKREWEWPCVNARHTIWIGCRILTKSHGQYTFDIEVPPQSEGSCLNEGITWNTVSWEHFGGWQQQGHQKEQRTLQWKV